MRHLVLALIVLLTASANVLADEATEREARARYERGKALVAKRQLADAYDEFARGYAASQRPAFLFNMAEAARGLGKLEVARDAYERYLLAEPEGPNAARARSRLAELPQKPVAPPSPPPAPPAAAVVVPPPAEAARHVAEKSSREPPERPIAEERTRSTRWPIWVGVGVVVVGAAVATYFLVNSRQPMSCGDNPNCVDFR